MTPHIDAPAGAYAETVLMPGDPKRAEYIANKFLSNINRVNDVRGCLGFTGYYYDKRVSVQASGMGQPSIGIYSYELFTKYDVKNIIRVGTCGSFQKHINVGDIIVAMTSSSESTQIKDYVFSPSCNYKLLKNLMYELNISLDSNMIHVGPIMSIDAFYHDDPDWWKPLANLNILGVDMETYMLYYNAMRTNKAALTVNMVSDNLWGGYEMTPNERVIRVDEMILAVLESL